eukprot:365006-Chlamydomonas_euryale.AAC.2
MGCPVQAALTPEFGALAALFFALCAPNAQVIEMKEKVTSKADIWSVGCLVIEIQTGSPPYFDRQPMSALFHIVADDHPPLPPNATDLMVDFLMQCFQKVRGLEGARHAAQG